MKPIAALLDAGSDLEARDKDGYTSWDYAKDNSAHREASAGRARARRHSALRVRSIRYPLMTDEGPTLRILH